MSPTLRKILTRFSECARFLSLGGEHPARKGHKSRTPERYGILSIVDANSLGRLATMGNARFLMIAPGPRSRFRAVKRFFPWLLPGNEPRCLMADNFGHAVGAHVNNSRASVRKPRIVRGMN